MFSVSNTAPSCLLRAYRDVNHARQFALHGRVRLQSVQSYRTIEDRSRQDPTEGEVKLLIPAPITTFHVDLATMEYQNATVAPGYLNYSSTHLNPVYVLCMASPEIGMDYIRERLGPYVVRINDSSRLLADVVESLQPSPIHNREIFFVDLCPVVYSKGEVGADPQGYNVRLSYAQKPSSFSAERECRLAVAFSGLTNGSPSELFLKLARAAEYCELIEEL